MAADAHPETSCVYHPESLPVGWFRQVMRLKWAIPAQPAGAARCFCHRRYGPLRQQIALPEYADLIDSAPYWRRIVWSRSSAKAAYPDSSERYSYSSLLHMVSRVPAQPDPLQQLGADIGKFAEQGIENDGHYHHVGLQKFSGIHRQITNAGIG